MSARPMAVTRALDRVSQTIGRLLAWLSLAMVTATVLIILLRTLAGTGAVALQESVSYMHATVFMLCLGYNLQQGGHVRVDVFYSRFSSEQKAWVNALGGVLFLVPFAVFLTGVSIDFVVSAWIIGETSPDPGGLPFVYLLKTLLPLAGVLLALQAVSETVKSIVAITWN